MNIIASFKRNVIYISLLSSLTLSTMETQASVSVPNRSEDIIGKILNINGTLGSILNPEEINVANGKLNISPDSQFTGSINGKNSDIHINQAKIAGNIYLHQLAPKDKLTTKNLKMLDTTLSSHHAFAAIVAQDSDVNIQNSHIENSTGKGVLIKKHMCTGLPSDSSIEKSTIISGNSDGISNIQSTVSINNTSIIAGKENENNSQALGISIFTNVDINHMNKTITNVSNSNIFSHGYGIFMNGGDTEVSNSIISARGMHVITTEGGNLTLTEGTELKAGDDAYGIYTLAGSSELYDSNHITLDNSRISTANNTAIIVYDREFDSDARNITDITLRNDSHVSAGNGIALQSWGDSLANLKVDSSHISGLISAQQQSIIDVELQNDAFFNGYTENINNLMSAHHSLWKVTESSDINMLFHAGDIVLENESKTGSELLIHKSYLGLNGTLSFNSKVTDERFLPGKLIILGNSLGNTNISINNIGGTGDAFLNRFELIHVDGSSNAVFHQSGRIVAGAYDYSLVRGEGDNTGNWYLTSQTSLNNPNAQHIVRPEAASYIANLSTANTLFATAMNDRPAETHYTDIFTGEKKRSRLWLRQAGSHNNWRDNNGQLTTQTNSTMTQLGGDILRWTTNSRNQGLLGLMIGQGSSHSNSHSSVTDYHSKSSVKGYSIGAYASWHGDNIDKSGLYINSGIQYNWFNNQVQGQGISAENYQSKGINTSLEAGYTINMNKLASSKETINSWFIQPQAQVTWMNVKASNHREANGTRVISNGEGNIQTRLGIRASIKGHHIMDKNKDRNFEPFIEVNWLHNTRDFGVRMDDDRIAQAGTRNIGEVKVGIDARLNPKINLWGNIGSQIGHKGYNNTNVMLGVKYNF